MRPLGRGWGWVCGAVAFEGLERLPQPTRKLFFIGTTPDSASPMV